MQKWQYYWVIFEKADSENINSTVGGKKYYGYEACRNLMNEIGEHGWELVGITSSFTSSGGYMQEQMIFKRPKE